MNQAEEEKQEPVCARSRPDAARALAMDLRILIENHCRQIESLGQKVGIERNYETGELEIKLVDYV